MTMVPGQTDDPVASRTGWTPLRTGGSMWCTHELHEVAPHRIELRPAAATRRICQAIAAAGLVVLAAFIRYAAWRGVEHLDPALFAIPVSGISLIAIGWGMIRLEMVPVTFDTREGWYWKGGAEPQASWDKAPPKNGLRLSEIHAIQVLAETYSGRNDDRTYTSYELNIVGRDGRRRNVVDHGNQPALQAQAHALARLLHVSLWDASISPNPFDQAGRNGR
jgi:hypothetical protein